MRNIFHFIIRNGVGVIRFVRSLLLLLGLATLPACAAYEPRMELSPAPALQAPSAAMPVAATGKVTTTRTVTVHFDSNSDEIRAAAMQILYGAAIDLRGSHLTSIRITGHADAAGRRSYNQKLSERRAAAVAAQLGKLGLRANTITVTGNGESKGAPRHHADDRRVEIVIEQVEEIAATAPMPIPATIGILAPAPHVVAYTSVIQPAPPPQDVTSWRSPEPLRSAGKSAIKRDLVLDGTLWLPPPAA